ncbi:bifunctional adenosylcobinamide kinase/adenosylcobinamide-phosphate guanylyltransferase [Psychrobacillus sp. INOP01]|uniref:bifunctional adenosylcobinamide kinase/adenosylcobinamide-phosphate guanylyltransferase n=1 Tax=Psychrobacillus sp. INOP01 TaxID=2829187 RepID=UPI001BABCE67|nr:bifunctional adenosylcobinamide kinase/adenosylcobinamide-phosphate guanylyltransferase [Psychrobacillus sp. INOP01]QUG40465.1 bifunctional adenosylcobinamide kinase/adenosylcobinamide-phosphate guanylyltransferase [Psychrobacillus sp. INOP01]
MHVIFGGAFNGKRAYVEQRIQGRNVQWLDVEADAYFLMPNIEVVVVFGVENLLEPKGKELLEKLGKWDKQAEVLVIATEIGRGIVPMDASMRMLRDDVGRFYQQLFTKADSVTRIWYGISQTIKGDEQIENLH